MAENNNTFEGIFIGIVCDYDKQLRTLEVFVPKLMPAVPKGRKTVSTKTNLGNSNIKINFNKNVKTCSSITAYARNVDDPLPDVNSRVFLIFLENDPKKCYWEQWNSNNDYTIIESERYKKLFSLIINGKPIDIKESDKVIINLPEGSEVLISKNNSENEKIIDIKSSSDIDSRVSALEKRIGNYTYENYFTTRNGEITTETIESTGLLKDIENLKKRLEKLENNK